MPFVCRLPFSPTRPAVRGFVLSGVYPKISCLLGLHAALVGHVWDRSHAQFPPRPHGRGFCLGAAQKNHSQRAKQLVCAERDQCDANRDECVFDPAMTLSSEHVFCLPVGKRTGGGYAGESERPAAWQQRRGQMPLRPNGDPPRRHVSALSGDRYGLDAPAGGAGGGTTHLDAPNCRVRFALKATEELRCRM